MRVLVTGGSGMVGHAVRGLFPDAMYLSSSDVDLRSQASVDGFFLTHTFDAVIHLAARVGGIIDNNEFQYDYFYQNMMINLNCITILLNME